MGTCIMDYLLLVEDLFNIKDRGVVASGRILFGRMPDSLSGKTCTIIKRQLPVESF